MGVTIGYNGDTIASLDTSGSKTLLTAGKYCAGNISVDYQAGSAQTVPCKSFTVTLAADQTAKTYLTSADNEVQSHRSDTSFWVAVIPLWDLFLKRRQLPAPRSEWIPTAGYLSTLRVLSCSKQAAIFASADGKPDLQASNNTEIGCR